MVGCVHVRSAMVQTRVGSHDVRILVGGCSCPCSKPGKSHAPHFFGGWLLTTIIPPCLLEQPLVFNDLTRSFWMVWEGFVYKSYTVLSGWQRRIKSNTREEAETPLLKKNIRRPPRLCATPGLHLAPKSGPCHHCTPSLWQLQSHWENLALPCINCLDIWLSSSPPITFIVITVIIITNITRAKNSLQLVLRNFQK